MKETRVPPALAANLVENSDNTTYGVSVIVRCPWKNNDTFTFCIKSSCISRHEIKTDDIVMSPKQILVPVHTMHAMSRGYTFTFTF